MKNSTNEFHICIVSPGYPNHGDAFFVFVEKLVNEFAQLGLKCTVISPQSITKSLFRNKRPGARYFLKNTGNGNDISIYQPYYLSFSNYKIMNSIARFSHRLAIKKTFNSMDEIPDVIYAHFWDSGLKIFKIAKENTIPLFVATGEDRIPSFNFVSKSKLNNFSEYVAGVIAVSSKNKKESVGLGLTTEEKCVVLNNAINPERFFKKDKVLCREKLGFPQQDFIVVFVGYFIERKGIKRVSKAIEMLNDLNIKSIFIGEGSQNPTCEGILHCGAVPNENVVDYLNCADIFVLPTLKEGCCNAIVEAMACGLPIISSNLDFNDDILNEINAIRIDPNNVEQIATSIKLLKDSPDKRATMSTESLRIASTLTLNNRATKIVDYMQRSIDQYKK